MQPTRDRDTEGIATWDESYKLSASKNLWGDPPVPFVVTATDLFGSTPSAVVLDIPCGDGRNLPPLMDAIGFVVGVDSSPNALAIAQRLTAATGARNVMLMHGDVFATTFVDNTFDGVFCCDLLGHLTEPARAIKELIRICKPGGTVIGTIFSLGDSTRGPNMVKLSNNEEYIFDDRFYFKFYDHDLVVELLASIGVEATSLELVRWMEPPHEGYREYEHQHESWLFTITKRA
jgi:ubiquinone/menaquinone biosynthesis C-methylase UbiE